MVSQASAPAHERSQQHHEGFRVQSTSVRLEPEAALLVDRCRRIYMLPSAQAGELRRLPSRTPGCPGSVVRSKGDLDPEEDLYFLLVCSVFQRRVDAAFPLFNLPRISSVSAADWLLPCDAQAMQNDTCSAGAQVNAETKLDQFSDGPPSPQRFRKAKVTRVMGVEPGEHLRFVVLRQTTRAARGGMRLKRRFTSRFPIAELLVHRCSTQTQAGDHITWPFASLHPRDHYPSQICARLPQIPTIGPHQTELDRVNLQRETPRLPCKEIVREGGHWCRLLLCQGSNGDLVWTIQAEIAAGDIFHGHPGAKH